MKASEVRQKYLEFMKSKGHVQIAPAALVLENDPTTLFTGSGMQPLMPYLLGKKHEDGTRLTNSQPCLRLQDIDDIGDPRHSTVFEMLGNWSLGDYFKEEQIRNFFTFLTQEIGLNPEKIYVTCFIGSEKYGIPRDDEAASIWQKVFAEVGIEAKIAEIDTAENGDKRGIEPGERIFFYNDKENWWSRGGGIESTPIGDPCGPDSEVFYDFGEDKVEVFAPWFGPKPNNYGTLVAGILADAQEQFDNLQVYFSTPVVQLVKDADGAIVGVGQGENGFIKFNAKSVILATGAYENNATMVRRFCPDIEHFDKKVYHRTGDGNILAIEAGGAMEPVAHSRVMHDFDAGLMWDEHAFLDLNMNGERFVSEEVDMAYISNVLRWQPGFVGENMDHEHQETGSLGWYCQIYDNDYMQYATAGVPEVVMQRYLKEEDPSLHVGVFPELIDTFRADTIEELAEKMGLPVEATVASFNRYNEMCEKGEDLDFGKKPEFLHKFVTAPFWGIRRHIRCSSITAGVLSDEYGRVVKENGDVIPGLYAVGNLGGQFYGAPDYPFFHPGLSLGHAVTFGFIAGEHAAQNL